MSTAGAASRRVERKLVERLREAGAVSPSSAIPIPDQSWIGKRIVRRLIGAGAIHEAGGGYYLDEPAYAAYRSRRTRRVALIVIPLAIVAMVVVWWSSAR